MAGIINNILKRGKSIKRRFELNKPKAYDIQAKLLRKHVLKAAHTSFGMEHNFNELYFSENIIEDFRSHVQAGDYLHMSKWWNRSIDGEDNVAWPGTVKKFALSSGTSDGASKYIPVTDDMNAAIKRTAAHQFFSIARSNIPADIITKDSLMVSGSTDLQFNGKIYSGDLSGITSAKIPFWFQQFAKPNAEIKSKRNWEEKIDEMVREAPKWDVGVIAGVPAWIQILFERIIKEHRLNNIHDIWPNFGVYIHGGVAFPPYKQSLQNLLGNDINYFETYLASEGFMAYQNRPDAKGMKLVIKNGIYYEFVPFTSANFDEDGNMKSNAQVISLMDVELNTDYALLISTCSGAWRYLIGDVIRFVDFQDFNIVITGRTKHFLSLCGEHLSVDNMTKAISLTAKEFNVIVNEFTVSGIKVDNHFGHHWVIACDNPINSENFKNKLDDNIKFLNDDYITERNHALKHLKLDVISNKAILSYLEHKGKVGSQNKFPRVLKEGHFNEFLGFMKINGFMK